MMVLALLLFHLIGQLLASVEIEPLQCNVLFNATHGPMPCRDTLELHNSTCGTGKPFAGNFNNDSICDLGCLISRTSTNQPFKFEIYTGMTNGTINPPISFSNSYGENWPLNQHTPYALNVDGEGVDEIMLVRHTGSWSSGNNTVLLVDNNDDLELFGVQSGRTILTMTARPLSEWCSSSGIIRFGDIDCDGKIDYHCTDNGVDQILSGLDTSSSVAYASRDSVTCRRYEITNGYIVSPKCSAVSCRFGWVDVFCNFGFEISFDYPDYEGRGYIWTLCGTDFLWYEWSDTSCEKIPICTNASVDNGVVSYHHDAYDPDHYALVTCNTGYILVGANRIVCNLTTLQWMSPVPTCTLTCPANGTLDSGNFAMITSNQAKITCDQGFKYRGKPFEEISCDDNGPIGWPPLLCTEESFYHVFKTWKKKTIQNKVHFNVEYQKDASNCIEGCKETTMCRSIVYKEITSQCFMYDEFVSHEDMMKEEKSSVSVYSYH